VIRQIRALGAFMIVCFLILFVQLNRLTIFEAATLNKNPINTRAVIRDFSTPRGTITSADNAVLARSVPSKDHFKLQREYPEGDLFGHVTGFFSLNLGADGVEREYGNELAGRTLDLQLRSVGDLFVDRERTGNVVLSMRKDVQQVARAALGNREGSVVAIDPRSGAILAMWGFPSFDPNPLASHNTAAAAKYQLLLDADPNKPRLARTFRDRFFPGSTYKVLTATAALESGAITETKPVYPVRSSYTPPLTTRPIRNFGGSSCGGALFAVLRASCNVAFAQMAVDTGPDAMIATAESYGFNQSVPIDLPGAARSAYPTDFTRNTPALAQSGIGQNDVAATPLQMALVAAAVANSGSIMTPHVMSEVRDAEGKVVSSYKPTRWRHPMSEATAAILRRALIENAQRGTATRMQIPGFEVGGKTGTAQLGTNPPRSHAWIIGFAGPPGDVPHVAVAVLVEGQPGASEQTGGRVAAPIAKAVLEAVLAAE
jgi:peptidoglycan glycosyltransferase